MSESERQFPYFMPDEVALHNQPSDCWLSCLGGVYNLTAYAARNSKSPISKYLICHGGKDVSHWFDAREGECKCEARLRRYVEPASGRRRILLPFSCTLPEGVKSSMVPVSAGRCECACSRSIKREEQEEARSLGGPEDLDGSCWSDLEVIFNDSRYLVGWLSRNPRPCKITNVLTGQRCLIWVCEEDSIRRIQERALLFNAHGASYAWKFEGKALDLERSLSENGIPDERERYLACGLPDDPSTYVPNLLCYYKDDLSEA